MRIADGIKYIGVDDCGIDLFEGLYEVPDGVTYNSYVILDEKIAVMDTVEAGFKDIWLEKLEEALKGRRPDYLIVQHMEPDHSANIQSLVRKYPDIMIAASEKAFVMMEHFFGTGFSERRLVIADGDTLSLGRHKLTFLSAVMVHWPEVMMTYEETDKILFSADAFGAFGTGKKQDIKQKDVFEKWEDEAARYYFGIVGRYGISVQKILQKLEEKEIRMICPLHGEVLGEPVERYFDRYRVWSSYQPEKRGVLIAYASVYGNTKKAALLLAEKLKEEGVCVSVKDLIRTDPYEAVAEAFRFDRLVLASATYCTDIFPAMREFIDHLTGRNFSNRFVAFMENGSWMPVTAKLMKEKLEKCRGITFAEHSVKLMSSLDKENKIEMDALAEELCSWKKGQEMQYGTD